MKEYKRRYWDIPEETTNKIKNLYNENKEELESKRRVYGEIIEIAIDNLINDLKNNSLEDIKDKLY